MANNSETQFPTESTTFFAYFGSIVSTINGTMTETPTESTILSTILHSTTASGLKCEKGYSLCDKDTDIGCSNGGICCALGGNKNPRCICKSGYDGSACHKKIPTLKFDSSTGSEAAQLTAVISALIGVVVISLFVAVVVLQFKYYKQRKKRRQKDDEIRKSMRVKPDLRRKDDASTRLLRTQPGYSWRQSVKRATHASQKLKGLSMSMSISVPENLFEIGLTREREKETNQTTKSGDGRAGGRRGEAEGSERFSIDPVNSSSTAQLLQDKDPSTKAVQFQTKSDVVHL